MRGLFLGCLLLPWLLLAQVRTTLDRSTIGADETAQFTVTITGSDLNAWPDIPPVPELEFKQGSGSKFRRNENGVVTEMIQIGYVVRATKAGDYTIGPVKVKVGGVEHQSQPVMLKVTPAKTAAAAAAEEINKLAFIQLKVPKNEFYLGEMFPLEMNLFFQSARSDMPQLKADGFSLSSPPLHTQGRVRLATGTYQQHTFRYAAKALKSGDVVLGPAECSMELQIPVQGTDPVFGGIMQRYRSQPMTVRSEPAKLKILPLPEEGRPANFNGAIGKFNFRMVATKNEVAVGDPVILQVEINGIGAWDAVQLPPTDDWRDFKIYPPNSEFKPLDDLGIQGVKRYELVVVPENSDVKEIPPMAFTYFDTGLRKYQTINVAPIPLKVRASSAAPAQPTVASGAVKAKTEEPTAVKDVFHIKPHLGTVVSVATPTLVRPWFWMVSALPLLAWAVLAFRLKQAELAARNPRAQRAKAVAQSEAAGLAQLSELAAGGKSKEFFDLLAKLLQERLGERLDMPASAITEAVVDERLGVLREESRKELHELFQACNQARYAPVSDVAKLDALVERARKVLASLMEVKG